MINKLPLEWIDRLFMRLAAMYGNKFTKMWDGIPRQEQIETWAEMLADMDKNDLATGLKNCINSPYPPTLPEFRLLCLPKYEPERVFNFARELYQKRYAGYVGYTQKQDEWAMESSQLAPNIIYHAISKLDSIYLNANYKDFKSVWISILDESVKNRKSLNEIPDYTHHIANNKTGVMDKEVAKAHLERLRELLKNG